MRPLSRTLRLACGGLAATLALQAPLAQAGMIGPEAVAAVQAASQAEQDRAKVQQFLENATLQERLRALGVDGLQASERVKALTQEEVQVLAQRIDSLPAGGALSDRDIILVLLVALLIVVAL